MIAEEELKKEQIEDKINIIHEEETKIVKRLQGGEEYQLTGQSVNSSPYKSDMNGKSVRSHGSGVKK